jgi:hypothetical protein
MNLQLVKDLKIKRKFLYSKTVLGRNPVSRPSKAWTAFSPCCTTCSLGRLGQDTVVLTTNRVWIGLAPPPWGKSFLSSWSSTESALNQNKNHVGLEFASLMSCWNKFPYIRSRLSGFSNPNRAQTLATVLAAATPLCCCPRRANRPGRIVGVRHPICVFPIARGTPETPLHHYPSSRKKCHRRLPPSPPPPPQGRQNELAISPRCRRSKPCWE